MSTRAARSDAALRELEGIARGVEELINCKDATGGRAALQLLREVFSTQVDLLTAYDERTARARIESLADSVDALAPARSRFALRARRRGVGVSKISRESAGDDVGIKDGNGNGKVTAEASETSEQLEDVRRRVVNVRFEDAVLSGLRGTNAYISGEAAGVRLGPLEGCCVSAPNVEGPLVMRGCVKCTVVARARQVRMHDCSECVILLNVSSGPVIEGCQGIVFGSWNEDRAKDIIEKACADESGDGAVWEKWKEGENGNMWNQVKDFNWHREGPSNNWRITDDV